MGTKQILTTVICILLTLHVYSQSGNNNSEYRKFYLSLNAGWDFPLGKSNTIMSDDFTLPLTKSGFTPGLDAAWFFSKNYGIGIKYRYYNAKQKEESYSEYTEQTFEYPVFEYKKTSLKERSHVFGPAFFARWSLGSPKWTLSSNVGIMYLYNKLYKMEREVTYIVSSSTPIFIDPSQYPESIKMGCGDLTGNHIGFAFSAGIRYQIIPLIGAGININGLWGSLSEMKFENTLTGKQETTDVSRKMNRIGISAAIDFNF